MTDEYIRYKYYLHDLGHIVKDMALTAKKNKEYHNGTDSELYYAGELSAYASIVTIMQEQAEAFQIPASDTSVGDIDVERDLL